MVDWNHYKKAYSEAWDAGNRRERLVAQTVDQLGLDVEMDGLGAGSTEFIPGRATEHGKDKADPDLFVPETETYIEVTGTNVGWVRPEKDIRVRPDKFENALDDPDGDHWIVHVLDGPALLRCIELTEDVCTEFHDQEASVDTRHDDDETYVEIEPDHDAIQPFTTLLLHLAPEKEAEFEAARQTALAEWTTADDIADGTRYSIALRLETDDPWENHDSIDRRLHLTDRTGDDVTVTIFEGNEFTSYPWTEREWYLFYDFEGEIYEDDPYLKPKGESEVRELADRYVPA